MRRDKTMASDSMHPGLVFEGPIYELETRIARLEQADDGSPDAAEELRRLRRELTELIRRIYANLSPWQTVQVARHKDRPQTLDYLSMMFDEFVELHGDKHFGDDRAIRTGLAKLDQRKVMFVGHHSISAK